MKPHHTVESVVDELIKGLLAGTIILESEGSAGSEQTHRQDVTSLADERSKGRYRLMSSPSKLHVYGGGRDSFASSLVFDSPSFGTHSRSEFFCAENVETGATALIERSPHGPHTKQWRRSVADRMSVPHPNICRMLGLFEEPEHTCVVIDVIPGVTLHGFLKTHHTLPQRDAINILVQIAAALDHLHANGFAHGDLRPENIIVGHDQSVCLIDFGSIHTPAIQSEHVMGKMGYMAPEVMHNAIGPASDQYALAAIAFIITSGAI